MSLIVSHMRWIMLVSGVLTMTMLYAAIAPQAMLRSSFGEALDGPLAEVVVRNWGALIALGGGLLVYGAYHVEQRPPILVFSALGKAVFIGLVLAQGQRYLGQQAVVALVLDSVMIVLFAWYLLAVRGSTRPTV